MAIDALGQLVRAQRRTLTKRQEDGSPQSGGQKRRGRKRRGRKQAAAAPQERAHPHWPRVCVQLVPPAGSNLMVPTWSLQKPRSPVLPTVCGTTVTASLL